MDKPSKELIHTESETVGGVIYAIRVVREDGYLFGEWTCSQCKLSGSGGVGSTEIKDAVFSAGKSLDTHHKKTHARSGAETSSAGTDAQPSDGPGLRLIRTRPPAAG